jgi:serine/threonine protein kinase
MQGTHEYTTKGQKFILPLRYAPCKNLGSGSYGIVISAKDTQTSEKVAIKRCGNVFKHCEDGKRILREIKMMTMLEHRNVLSITDVFVPSSTFDDIYIVTPCLDTDLSQILKTHTLTDTHIKYIMYQILRGLKYVHSANILHRDLKPANILLNYDCHVKLCDFGLARGYDPKEKVDMTSYIVTRWYRAPELLLSNTDYSGAIDIWAAGCIFAELLTQKALFPGESSANQLELICNTIPVPEWEDLWWVQSAKSRQHIAPRAGRPPIRDLKSIMGSKASAAAFDMLEKMLNFHPHQRWNAEMLLDHPYLAEVRSTRHLQPAQYKFKWKWDSVTNLKEEQLRRLFWQELVAFHPECVPPGTRAASPVAVEARLQERPNYMNVDAHDKERERDSSTKPSTAKIV